MPKIAVRPMRAEELTDIRRVVAKRYAGEPVVTPSGVYRLDELSIVVALVDNVRHGFLAYRIDDAACEIALIANRRQIPGPGVGIALLAAAQALAQRNDCKRLWVTISNDRLEALRFFQKRGFRIATIHRDAMASVRDVKPNTPLEGQHGIPLNDMIELDLPVAPKQS